MREKPTKASMILLVGLIGIIAALITIISDFILIGRPTNAYSFFMQGTEIMAELAPWRLTVGTFLGVVALPFQIVGLITVYNGLKLAGRRISLLVVITAAHALIIGVGFHISYAFIGSGWKLYYEIGAGNILATDLVKRFDFFWRITIIIMLVDLILSSIIYFIIIIKRKTLYPKWMSLLNPLCIVLVLFPIIYILPAPIGGFIASGCLNISTAVFYGFSTMVIYKKLKNKN